MLDPPVPEAIESSLDEESTRDGNSQDGGVGDSAGQSIPVVPEEATGFGPIRSNFVRHNEISPYPENNALTQALRASSELLDLGETRLRRTNNETSGDATITTPDTLEVVALPDDPEDQCKHHFDAFLINVNTTR